MCGTPFTTRRSHARHCSDRCRQAARRWQPGGQAPQAAGPLLTDWFIPHVPGDTKEYMRRNWDWLARERVQGLGLRYDSLSGTR